jgi:AcrR family transcriptional regulator
MGPEIKGQAEIKGQGRSPGRPLDESRYQAIFDAVLESLAEVGYDRLTVDMIAGRARAGKGALYRRWDSKEDMVMEALSTWEKRLEVPDDTGSLRGDLQALLDGSAGPSKEVNEATVVCGLMTAAARDPELATLMRERFVAPRRKVLRTIVERAVLRGEIPAGRNVELVTEVVPAFLFTRAVMYGESVSPDLFRTVITELVYPLLVAPVVAQW